MDRPRHKDPENVPGEVVQGLSVPRNRAEAQAARDHSAEVGNSGHERSIQEAKSAARRLEERHGLERTPRRDRNRER
jgi:uncharacterized protein YbbK (DUF523 family)